MVPRTHPSTAVTLHRPTLTACVSLSVPDCFKFCSNYSKRTNKGADYRVDHLTVLVARLCDDDDDTSEVKQKKEARLQQAMTSIAKRRAAEPADSRCDMLCVRMCKSTHTITCQLFTHTARNHLKRSVACADDCQHITIKWCHTSCSRRLASHQCCMMRVAVCVRAAK